MALILDLAVAALALAVVGSLWLLAWTLGVSSVQAIWLNRARVEASRRSVADTEARLRFRAARAATILSELAARSRAVPPGDRSDQ